MDYLSCLKCFLPRYVAGNPRISHLDILNVCGHSAFNSGGFAGPPAPANPSPRAAFAARDVTRFCILETSSRNDVVELEENKHHGNIFF